MTMEERSLALLNFVFTPDTFFVSPDVTANCICEIHCLALDGFDLNTVLKLSSKEKKSQRSRDLNLGLLGGKQECFHCAMQLPFFSISTI